MGRNAKGEGDGVRGSQTAAGALQWASLLRHPFRVRERVAFLNFFYKVVFHKEYNTTCKVYFYIQPIIF